MSPAPSAAGSPMQFRRRRVRGKTQTTYKEWRSDCGHYRVFWRNEIPGLGSARYYATVRCRRDDGTEFWDFAADRRAYRTLNTAQQACRQNQQTWQKFIDLADAPRKGRLDPEDEKIVVAGKNYASFDASFLRKLTNWGKHVNVHHRILDPAAMYWQPEIDGVQLPDTKTCMERAGIVGDVAHTAVEDAQVVVRLIRHAIDSRRSLVPSNTVLAS